MTWIDVVDSAVKIGLGALIAGAFSFTTTRLTYDRDARAERTRRRRDLLEKVLNMMNHFDKVYRLEKALFDTLLDLSRTPKDREEDKKQFEQLDEDLRVAFEKFADSSGILLILGETSAEAALNEYREVANEWYERALPEPDSLSAASLDQLKADITAKRSALMAKLAAAYKTL